MKLPKMPRKLQCFRTTHHDKTTPPTPPTTSTNDAVKEVPQSPPSQDLDQFRERGQAMLRRIIYERDNDEVDWMAVIRMANELHTQEQQWMKKQEVHVQSGDKEMALEERKRVDSTGSFAANMHIKRPSHHKKKSSKSPITSYFQLDDDDSACSTSDSSCAHKSWDTGSIYTIDEC